MASYMLKRKFEDEPSQCLTMKKQKLTRELEKISDESFRIAKTPHFGVIQPIGVPRGSVPLDDEERLRMKSWQWPEGRSRRIKGMRDWLESPRGTKNFW
jgi:hypothetical protein